MKFLCALFIGFALAVEEANSAIRINYSNRYLM